MISDAVSFAFVADEPAVTFECRIDSEAWKPCSSPITYKDLSSGFHTFEVRGTDDAGKGNLGPRRLAHLQDGRWILQRHAGDDRRQARPAHDRHLR